MRMLSQRFSGSFTCSKGNEHCAGGLLRDDVERCAGCYREMMSYVVLLGEVAIRMP